MNIYDQLAEIHSQLEYDEMWLSLIEDYFEEYDVSNMDDLIDKLADAEIEGTVYNLISEGENLLSLRETDEWFEDDYDDY